MLPFLRPYPCRFNDATFGAWYAADEPETSAVEKGFHLKRYLEKSAGSHFDVVQRVVSARLVEPIVNVQEGAVGVAPGVFDPDPANYGTANALARTLREAGALGLFYNSVRRRGSYCYAVFRPRIIADATLAGRARFVWDRSRSELQRYLEV